MAKKRGERIFDRVVRIVIQLKKQKFSDQGIKKKLYEKGWTRKQVKTIFKLVNAKLSSKTHAKVKKSKIIHKHKIKKHKIKKHLKVKKQKPSTFSRRFFYDLISCN